MALDSKPLDAKGQAARALHRFGFGPRAGSLASIGADARSAILAELDRPTAGQISDNDLLTSGEAARAAFNFRQERKADRLAQRAEREMAQNEANKAAQAAKEAQAAAPKDAPAMAATMAKNATKPTENPSAMADGQPAKPNPGPGIPQQIYLEEAKVRFDAALNAEIGFAERLVWFWSNHFCISADKVRPVAGAFEREAIRPHVLGNFADMLMAVESHPAMLSYLDNARSIGPNSMAGLRQNKGLNENLGRETLELHTLGARAGYSQADVTNFAKVITGWTITPVKQAEHGGEFNFNDRMHEPGVQTILAKSYDNTGYEQGRAVLLTLARHPATAKHIARKLALHFVSDDPPEALVDKLAKRFMDTKGDLKEVSKTLVLAPEAWDAPRTKIKKPSEWTVASMRACGMAMADVPRIMNTLNLLGEPLWRPPAPKGFADDNGAWLDGLPQRLDIANQISRRVGGLIDPEEVADAALGPLATPETRQTLSRAESRPQALALLLMAPEFLRR
jgi:uncharacterized protein (DUF1800 family)